MVEINVDTKSMRKIFDIRYKYHDKTKKTSTNPKPKARQKNHLAIRLDLENKY